MNPFLTIDSKEAIEALNERKFLRPNQWISMFPNSQLIEKDLDTRLAHISHGIGVALRENDSTALQYYCNFIFGYIKRFSFRLPAKTVTDLVPLLVQAATIPEQPADLVHTIFETIEALVCKSRLKRGDMIIPMKPLFDLFQGIIYYKKDKILYENVFGTLVRLRKFYSLEDVKDLWKSQLLSLLSPLEHGFHFVDLCITFLPMNLSPEEHQQYGAGLWFPTLWNLFSSCRMNVSWAKYLPDMFYKLERDSPGLIDWRPYDNEIFTRILRGFQMRGEDSSYGFSTLMKYLAHWVAYRLGGPHSCHSHLQRLFGYAEPLLHPSNSGPHTEVILTFLKELSQKVLARYRRERVKEHTKSLRPPEYHLNDEELRRFVSSIFPIVLPAVYIDLEIEENLPATILKILATFAPDMVLPKILELVYPALKASCEPDRFRQSLRCLEEVILLLCREKSETPVYIVLNDSANCDQTVEGSPFVEKTLRTSKKLDVISVRCHVVRLLEELVDGIDINDLDKIVLVIQIMSHIFYLIPNVDASALAGNTESKTPTDSLTQEEQILCRLTAKLPGIADKAIERIIAILEVMAAVPQRNEEERIGAQNETMGSDERTLKEAIEKCVNALFLNAVQPVRLKVAQRILRFVRTNVIAAPVAADMAQTLIQLTAFYVPEIAEELTTLVCQKVANGLKEFVESKEERSDVALQWWAGLFPCLVTTPFHFVSDTNRKKILNLVDDLLTHVDPSLYEPAALVLGGYLVFSVQIHDAGYVAVHSSIDKPLSNWIPVRHWATLHERRNMQVHWKVPNQSEIDFAQSILNNYLKESLDRLKADDATSDGIRRDLFVLRVLLNVSKPLLPPLNKPEQTFDQSFVREKIPCFVPRSKISMHELTLNGNDLCLSIVETLETVLNKGLKDHKDEARLLLQIGQCASFVTNSSVVSGEIFIDQIQTVNDLVSRVRCMIHQDEKLPLVLAYASLGLDYMVYQFFIPNGPFTSIHHRVLQILLKCSLSVYVEVRRTAREELVEICRYYNDAKHYVVDPVIEVLRAVGNHDEQAALHLIRDLKLAALPQASYRNRLWDALLVMTVSDRPSILRALDEIWTTIFEMQPLPQSSCDSPSQKNEERLEAEAQLAIEAEKFLDQLSENDFWKPFKTSDTRLKEYRKMLRDLEIRANEEFTLRLLDLCDSTMIHGKQRELARVMLWAANHFLPTPSVLKTFLAYTKDEQYITRRFAWHNIKHWLKINKPKTKKVKGWIGPERDPVVPTFACGIRSDNLFAAYAVDKLPKSEDEWNKTIFIKNDYGGYKWPSYPIDVEHGGCGLEESKVPEFDTVINEFFSNTENMQTLLNIWLLNTNDRNVESSQRKIEHNDVACAIKYLIRNYEHVDSLQQAFAVMLQELLLSKKKEEQRVAAELFFGVVKGSRHHLFSRLHQQWLWLTSAFKTLLDNINGECEDDWLRTISLILKGEDLRQFWWLVEALFESINSSMSLENSWHYAFKTSLLTSSTWRETELRNRLIEKTLKELPNAKMPGQREGVVNVLTDAVHCRTDNLGNNFSNVPPSFRLGHIDQWIERMYEKLAEYIRRAEKIVDAPTPRFQPNTPITISLASCELFSPKVGLSTNHPLASLNQVPPIARDGDQYANGYKALPPSPKTPDVLADVAARNFTLKLSQNRLFQSRTIRTPSPNFTISTDKCSSLLSIMQDENCDEAVIYLRTLIDLLTLYYKQNVFGISQTILATLPIILQMSLNEPDENSAHLVLGGELKQSACTLVFEYMAPAHIDEKYADSLLQKLNETFNSAMLWKVKQGVLKFIQIAVASNLFVFVQKGRRKRVLELVTKGITDIQAEVRGEAAKCLMLLVYSQYFDVDEHFIAIYSKLCTSSNRFVSEGGILAICAIVQAFPFNCPPFLPKLIDNLCSLSNSGSELKKKFTTQTLREFRRTHRECWAQTQRVLGLDLLYQVENACAPNYYV